MRFKKPYPKNSRLLSMLYYDAITKKFLQLTCFYVGGVGEASNTDNDPDFLGRLKE